MIRQLVALAFVFGCSGINAGGQQTSATLTLATYNIHTGVPMGEAIGAYKSTTSDLDNLSTAIATLNADVIALQEVDCEYGRDLPERRRSSQLNQARYLARTGNYSYIFGSAQDDTGYPTDNPGYLEWGSGVEWSDNGGEHGEVGNALLSRLHIVAPPENIPLPKDEGQERRACIRTVLALRDTASGATGDTRTTSIVIYATHLQHNSAETCHKQMQTIIDRIQGEPKGTIVFLLGDLNHELESPGEHNPIRLALESGLFDLGAPATNEPSLHTYPADKPDRRIDYVLSNHALPVMKKVVQPAMASDHLPVAITVQFP